MQVGVSAEFVWKIFRKGVEQLFLNQVAVEDVGPQVKYSSGHPIYIDQMDDNYPSVVEKSIIIFENLHNAGNDSAQHSVIRIQFQAILLLVHVKSERKSCLRHLKCTYDIGLLSVA